MYYSRRIRVKEFVGNHDKPAVHSCSLTEDAECQSAQGSAKGPCALLRVGVVAGQHAHACERKHTHTHTRDVDRGGGYGSIFWVS